MSTAVTFTLEEYDHMIQCGAFDPPNHKRLELIEGELREMSPIGPKHDEMVTILNEWSSAVTDRRQVRIRIQSSIRIPATGSAPEPDVVWAVLKSYARRQPEPPDILLLIEVAESSLAYDLDEKAEIYARAGVTDYWVVDIPSRRVHVRRGPSADGYQSHEVFGPGDSIAPWNVPDATLDVSELFACLE